LALDAMLDDCVVEVDRERIVLARIHFASMS